MKAHDKLGLLLAWLSRSIYRQWYWQHYKKDRDQQALRSAWFGVAVRYDWTDIKAGLQSWADVYGADHPPTPDEFYSFIAPSLSPVAKRCLSVVKRVVAEHV